MDEEKQNSTLEAHSQQSLNKYNTNEVDNNKNTDKNENTIRLRDDSSINMLDKACTGEKLNNDEWEDADEEQQDTNFEAHCQQSIKKLNIKEVGNNKKID